MDALFFGPPDGRLYGAYHPPSGKRSGDCAVVLCPPAQQEYMACHWAFRRLAGMLASAGAHVLRFDYFGMGDSAGATRDANLDRWREDIHLAREKLSMLSGVSRVSLVGYRLGAVLAWRASLTSEPRPRDLVLWDPCVKGSRYLEELRLRDEAFSARLLYSPTLALPLQELGGYGITEELWEATSAIELLTEPLPKATQVSLCVSEETQEATALSQRLAGSFKRYAYQYVDETAARGSGSLLSSQILKVITRAIIPEET